VERGGSTEARLKYLLSTLAAPLLLFMVVATDETSSRTDNKVGRGAAKPSKEKEDSST
jgi:hypothetical protein